MNPKERLQQIEEGNDPIYNFWRVRGYEKVMHCIGTNITFHKKPKYEHLGLDLLYLEQFKDECIEPYRKKLAKIINYLDILEQETDNWDKLCDCMFNDGTHSKSCMTINVRKDIERLDI